MIVVSAGCVFAAQARQRVGGRCYTKRWISSGSKQKPQPLRPLKPMQLKPSCRDRSSEGASSSASADNVNVVRIFPPARRRSSPPKPPEIVLKIPAGGNSKGGADPPRHGVSMAQASGKTPGSAVSTATGSSRTPVQSVAKSTRSASNSSQGAGGVSRTAAGGRDQGTQEGKARGRKRSRSTSSVSSAVRSPPILAPAKQVDDDDDDDVEVVDVVQGIPPPIPDKMVRKA